MKSDQIVRLKKPPIVKFTRSLWCIMVPAWWRGGQGYVPHENTLAYSRAEAWAKFEANYADTRYLAEARKTAKAFRVQIEHFTPPESKTQRKPWWVNR